MNHTIEFLKTRRSVHPRLMVPPGPSPDELQTILTIAARVPDHGRAEPWRFIVIEGEGQRVLADRMAEIYRADHPDADDERVATERQRLLFAPLIVAVVFCPKASAKAPEWEQILSAGAVCMNLSHAAQALGYGAAWLTHWYAYDQRFLETLGLEPMERIAGFIHIGTASERMAERPRPELDAIVTSFRV